MSDTSLPPSPPLSPGCRVGPNKVQRLLGHSPAGTSYEVTVGSTMHAYELRVLPADMAVGLETLERVIRPLASVLHPCLAKPFACGMDDGILWIRSELPHEVALGNFALPPAEDRKNPWPVGEMVGDAFRLRELLHGLVPQKTLWPLLADLLEGLASLHRAGIKAGPFDLESILFHRGRHGKGVIAKWVNYGLRPLFDPEGSANATIQDDVRSAGNVFRALLCGDHGTIPLTAWPEWEPFLARTQGGAEAFHNGIEMYEAFLEILDAKGLSREARHVSAEPVQEEPASDGDAPKRRQHEGRKRVGTHRRRSGESMATNSMSELMMGPAFKVLFMLGALCAVGFLAFWLVSRDQRLRKEGRIGASVRVLTSEELTPAEATKEETLWDLDANVLQERFDAGNAQAGLRLASLLARGTQGVTTDVVRAGEIATHAFDQMAARAKDGPVDADTQYWLGFARLTGLGTGYDPAQGVADLEAAAKDHAHIRAMDLLADFLASGQAEGDPANNDRMALQWWRTAIDSFTEWDTYTLAIADKAMDFVKAGRGLPRGDPASFVAWLGKLAKMQHGPSIMALGTTLLEGKIVSMDEPQAMRWFRAAALGGMAEGMRRMAWMFQRGIGTPQSDQTALIWFRRAAVAGDPEAMEELATLIEKGQGDEEANEAVVADWRKKASEARAAARASARSFAWWRFGDKAIGTTPVVGPEGQAPAATPEAPAVPAATAPAPAAPPVEPPASVPLPPVRPDLIEPSDSPMPLG